MRFLKPFVLLTQFVFRYFKGILETIAVVAGVAVLVVYALQLNVMQHQLRLDQRAWIGFTLPSNFPLEGVVTTPATLQITNFGKTPAREVNGDVVATELMKGEDPDLDFSIGHPHNRFYPGVIFPNSNSPLAITIPVQRYGAKTPTPIPPSELRQDLESEKGYIIFYGHIAYKDIFGKEHWTNFCTGSGKAIEHGTFDILRKCIQYNDVDHD